ncbi:hypothetical protein CALVIDRAFT_479759 [Calocera viscosa TUFC12733]|uniref:Uncharacterized protein n=1 Tax=Calocera viscosa (strain TUFC12733) TaxID=1330018 RepID=A0A167NG34_CALVF|nr:hypothetical protein CALVIDRAFT_479759 [Calocera viscosa TUFC12733]
MASFPQAWRGKRKSAAGGHVPRKRQRVSVHVNASSFPPSFDADLVKDIIREYQAKSSIDWLREVACAACGEKVSRGAVMMIDAVSLPVDLLMPDSGFPEHLHPRTYNLREYGGAFLHPNGLSNREMRQGDVSLCRTCHFDLLVRKTMPPLALCNRFYYAHEHLPGTVKRAFEEATFVDLRLAARYSASNICYSYKDDPEKVGLYGNQVSGAQRFSKGNTVILPRDHVRTEQVLPPPPDVLRSCFTTVFASSGPLDEEALRKIAPLKASRGRVGAMLGFLIRCNAAYTEGINGEGPVSYSADNMEAIFGRAEVDGAISSGGSLPACIQIGHLRMGNLNMESDVAGRNDFVHTEGDGEFYMEACGFVRGDHSAEKYRAMKAECLHRSLAGHPFLLSRAGDVPVRDRRNHLLLGGLFPHLDPFNVGGFEHPDRRKPVNVAKQVAHLLMLYNGPFERDPQFAFVYHNMIQKRQTTADAFFRVKETDASSIVGELKTLRPSVFSELARSIESQVGYKPSSDEEKRALRLLSRLHMVRKDAPGSNGYKTARRNEIRALIQKLGAPALFITITPTDIDSRLMKLFAGDYANTSECDVGETYGTKIKRAARVARNPGAAARSFHQTMRNFIDIILRWKHGPGLFGECLGVYGMVEAQG